MGDGYTGLSFPMRLNNKGGLKMSTTSAMDFSHIEESIIQILNTYVGERVMETYFGSDVSSHIFDPTDESAYSLIKHEIMEALVEYEPRIEVSTEDIEITSDSSEPTGRELLRIIVNYTVIKYGRKETTEVNLGGDL